MVKVVVGVCGCGMLNCHSMRVVDCIVLLLLSSPCSSHKIMHARNTTSYTIRDTVTICNHCKLRHGDTTSTRAHMVLQIYYIYPVMEDYYYASFYIYVYVHTVDAMGRVLYT